MGSVKDHKVIVTGRTCRLSWDGEGFNPEEFGIVKKTIYNNRGFLYCPDCGDFYDVSEFYKNTDGTPKTPCRTCRGKYLKRWKNIDGYKKNYHIKRAIKSGDKNLVKLIESIPDKYFEEQRFSIKRVPLSEIPKELQIYAMSKGVGSKTPVQNDEKKEPERKKKIVRTKNRHVCNDKVRVKGTFKLLKKTTSSKDEDMQECPVCDTRKPVSMFNTEYSYCCSECERRIRNDESCRSHSDGEKGAIFVRNREEVIEMFDEFEMLFSEMKSAAERCDTEAYLQLRNKIDFLRNKIDVAVHWKRGIDVHVYRIPLKQTK